MSKKIEDKYKILSQVEHIILRPATYLGSNKPHQEEKWIWEGDKLQKKKVTIIPSFIKIFDEVLMNSVDESKRNSKLNRIDITIDLKENSISVLDNGGIPVVTHSEYGIYIPEVVFGTLMSGSNYDDTDERVVAGMNGLGAKLTNIFSKKFIVTTCDGKKKFHQVYSDNMGTRTTATITNSKKPFTEIKWFPDFEKFGMECIDDDHFQILKKRVIDVAACNTVVDIYLNGEKINFKTFDDYVKLYTPVFFSDTNKDKSWHVCVALSDAGFQQVSFVNSTETYDGGTHVEYIMSQIITELRAFFLRKHKTDVKPSELRNHMFLFLNSTVINPSFTSQTKEKLITEQKEFVDAFEISAKLVNAILKSDIVHSILDWIQQKKAADESKAARQLNKSLDKIKVDKLIDAKSKDRKNCECFIFEGDSASVSFRKYRDSQTQGAFTLRGKFMNVAETTTQKLVDNNEVVNLMASLGLKLGQKVKSSDIRYGKIYLAVDADYDGNSIAGLLINFIFKFWPELFEMKMVYKLETPIVIARNKKTNKKLPFFSQKEYNDWIEKASAKDWEIKYKKGLSALVDDEYQDMVQKPKLTLITKDDFSHASLQTWFGKDSEPRKIELLK
jgi:DNA topoisomerase-2